MPDIGAGFWSTNRLLSAATTNATLVKPSPGQLGGYYFFNSAAYAVYLKFYDTSTTPTAGSGTPKLTLGIPAGAAGNLSFGSGISFSSGIGFTMTKLPADNDTTALAANDLILNLYYA